MRHVGGLNQKPKILVVEDVPEQRHFIESSLAQDFLVDSVENGSQALAQLRDSSYDLILLDVVLPDVSGYDLCSTIRSTQSNYETPIVFLSSRESLDDRVTGLSLGGDDYVIKPFHPSELKARMMAHIRRFHATQKSSEVFRAAHLEIDTGAFKAYRLTEQEKDELNLTTRELRLLHHFCQNIDTVLSRSQVLNAVWGTSTNVTDRTVDTHVCQLRKKIDGTGIVIESVYGCGYRTRLEA